MTAILLPLLVTMATAGAQITADEDRRMLNGEVDAAGIMSDFAERTGLDDGAEPRRYLWTDAFALHNFLYLLRETSEARWGVLAARLIEQVHGVLGRHRPDDLRSGWLSGFSEQEGATHPTRGGLRIGKPRPERRADEPYDEALEWERDGQYFHYLTKWMDALARAATALDEPAYHRYATELAEGVFPEFLQRSPAGEPVGLAWKMSIDLSRPQVAGINPHDALDGYATFRELAAGGDPASVLEEEIEILREMSEGRDWTTSDPLGIGGLLLDALRLATLPDRTPSDERLIRDVLAGAEEGLRRYVRLGSLRQQPSRRLAFRELGLAIGLQALPLTATAAERAPSLARAVAPHLESLLSQADSAARIVEFWSDPLNRENGTWQEHRDINEVMLATALLRAQPGQAGIGNRPSPD